MTNIHRKPMVKIPVLVGIIWLLSPLWASASDDKAEAERHFEVGKRLYETDDFQGAAVEFEASVRLFGTKNGWFNLANCYTALHRYADALAAIESLETQFKDDLTGVLKQKTAELKKTVLSIVGGLTIAVEPKAAGITVDGRPVDPEALNGPLLLGPGEYRVEASYNGFETRSETVSVKSKETSHVFISLMPSVGRLSVEVDRPGATVEVGGEVRGKSPLQSLVLAPGNYSVTVSLNGYEPVTREVAVRVDAETVVHVELAPPPPSRIGASGMAVGGAVPVDSGEKGKPALLPLKITGLVLTVGLGAASAVFWVTANKAASDFDEYDTAYGEATSDDDAARFYNLREDAYDKNRLRMKLGIGFAVGAGVIGLSTLILTLVTKNRGDSKASPKKAALRFEGTALILDF